MKIIYYFISIIFVLSCNYSNPIYMEKEKNCSLLKTDIVTVQLLIDTIAKSYSSTTIELEHTLEERSQFMVLHNSPICYQKNLIFLLSSDTISPMKREIVLYSLQKLKIDEYVEVINVCYKLLKKSVINERLLMNSISQIGFSREVIRNYNHPKLNKILSEIQASKLLKDKNNIDFISRLIIGKILIDVPKS